MYLLLETLMFVLVPNAPFLKIALILNVCALQEHERTRTQFTQKNSKILIKICVTSERENKFPEGESPLYARPQTGLKY